MGPGEGFGEIALLGSTTRTMTVRATEETRLLGLGAGDFLPRRHEHQRRAVGRRDGP